MHSLTKLTALASLLSLVPKVLASHAVFLNPTSGETIRIHLDGDTSDLSEVEYYTINTTKAVPDIHYKTPAELMLLEERDICEDIATCFTQGAYNAVLFYQGVTWANTVDNCIGAYDAISTYMTANNYANTNAIMQGVVAGIIVVVPTFYINMRLQNTVVATTNDACGDDSAPTVANNAANAIYAYCVQLRANQQNNLPTGYGAMDVTSATDDNADGIEALATVFLSSQAAVYAPICSAVGVTWDKRSIYRLGRVAREID